MKLTELKPAELSPSLAADCIRLATPDDAEELLSIYAYYVQNTAVTFEYEPPTEEEFRRRITAVLKRYPYLCAISDGRIQGFAFARAFRERPAYDYSAETTIYLRHDARRQGWGKTIYTALENELKKMGVTNLYACIAVPDGEDPHLSNDSPLFHERLGYRKVGEFYHCGYKFDRWYTMIWMEKIIGSFPEKPAPLIPYPALSNTAYRYL